MRPWSDSATNVRPLALGYLRLYADAPPELAMSLTAELVAYAEKEQLTLAEIYTDPFDPPPGGSERAGFCGLMDALRRHNAQAVIIPTTDDLSRRANGYTARRTIIETEGGARLLVIHPC